MLEINDIQDILMLINSASVNGAQADRVVQLKQKLAMMAKEIAKPSEEKKSEE